MNVVRPTIWISSSLLVAAAIVSSIIGLVTGRMSFFLLSALFAVPASGLMFLLVLYLGVSSRKMWSTAWTNAASQLAATLSEDIPREWLERLQSQDMYRTSNETTKVLAGCRNRYDYLLVCTVSWNPENSTSYTYTVFFALQTAGVPAFLLQPRFLWRMRLRGECNHRVLLSGRRERDAMARQFVLHSKGESDVRLLELVDTVFVPLSNKLRGWRFGCDKGLLCVWPAKPKTEWTASVEEVTTRRILSAVETGLKVAAAIDDFTQVAEKTLML